MTRRSFLGRLAAGIAGLAVAPSVTRLFVEPVVFERLTFRGVPLVWDEHCSPNTVYFLSHDGLWRLTCDNPRKLGVITGITE